MNGVISVDFTNEGTLSGETYTVTEPVSLSEVKKYLKIEDSFTFDDDLLNELITAAREEVESYINRSLIPRTVTAVIMNESGGTILPYGVPSGEVTATDEDGNAITSVDITAQGNFRYLDGPIAQELKISFSTAGFTSATIPARIRLGLKQLISYWYKNRDDETKPGIPMLARKTLSSERIKNVMFL